MKSAVSLLLLASMASAAPWSMGPKITTASPLPTATAAKAYSLTFSAQSGKPPYRWAATTSLPPGLAFSNTGTLSGISSVAATYAIGVVVVDSKNKSAAGSFVLVVSPGAAPPPLTINPALPSGTVGQPYNVPLQIQGGTPPYHCDPDPTNNLAEFGLALTTDCWVRGTPSKAGSVHF